MTAALEIARPSPKGRAPGALTLAARLWFAVAVIGQALFLYYIARFYFPSTLTGNFKLWRLNPDLTGGYTPGDPVGNLAFAAHVLLAGVITFAGVLQLVPQIRARAPRVHRWMGRAFLAAAMGASLVGLYMTWARHTSGLVGQVAISIDATLIIAFGTLAWRTARARDFAAHRRWALRAFLVANGVWFIRISFAPMAMLISLMHGPRSLIGQAFDVWNFGAYLVPLGVLELYFRAQASAAPRARAAMAAGLAAVAVLMSLGVVAAWFAFFAPVLAKL